MWKRGNEEMNWKWSSNYWYALYTSYYTSYHRSRPLHDWQVLYSYLTSLLPLIVCPRESSVKLVWSYCITEQWLKTSE